MAQINVAPNNGTQLTRRGPIDLFATKDSLSNELDKLTSAEIEELLHVFERFEKKIDSTKGKEKFKSQGASDKTPADEGEDSAPNSTSPNHLTTAVDDVKTQKDLEDQKIHDKQKDNLDLPKRDSIDLKHAERITGSPEQVHDDLAIEDIVDIDDIDIDDILEETNKETLDLKPEKKEEVEAQYDLKEQGMIEDGIHETDSSQVIGAKKNELTDKTENSGSDGGAKPLLQGKRSMTSLSINPTSSFISKISLGFLSASGPILAAISDANSQKDDARESIDTTEDQKEHNKVDLDSIETEEQPVVESNSSKLCTEIISQPNLKCETFLHPKDEDKDTALDSAADIVAEENEEGNELLDEEEKEYKTVLKEVIKSVEKEEDVADIEIESEELKEREVLEEKIESEVAENIEQFDVFEESLHTPILEEVLLLKDEGILESLRFNESHSLLSTGDDLMGFEEGTPDQSIYDLSYHESFLNPVQEDLKLEPIVKELKLDSVLRRSANTTIDYSDPETTNPGIELEDQCRSFLNCEWMRIDLSNFFSIDSPRCSSVKTYVNIETAEQFKSNMNKLEYIYISDAISDPASDLKYYSTKTNYDSNIKIQKKTLLLDFSLKDFLAFKSFNETVQYLSKVKSCSFFYNILNGIEIKLETIDVTYSQYIFDQLKSLGILYNSIRSLGILNLAPEKITDRFSGQAYSKPSKYTLGTLPANLSKLVVSNGLDMDDGIILNGSLKFAAFYNCWRINLSKFNVTRKLEKLHIFTRRDEQLEIAKNSWTEQFPAGLSELRELKLSTQVFMNPNLQRSVNLQSLTLSDLNVTKTRRLILPPTLKVLAFENCSISSHMGSFPSSLKKLIIKGGKWREQHILTYSRLKELRIDNVEVPDIFRKVNYSRELTSLIINNCRLKSLRGLKFQNSLRHIDLKDNEISLLKNSDLDNLISLKELKLSNNKLEGRIDLENSQIETLDLSDNIGISSVELPKTIKHLNLSSTGIQAIEDIKFSLSLESISLRNCNIGQVKYLIPPSLEKLDFLGCQISSIELKFAAKTKLKTFDISNNCIESVEKIDFKNSVAESINILSNRISQFDLLLPPTTEILNLSNNRLESYFLASGTVRTLDLLNNKIKDISKLELHDNLEVLYLNHNPLGSISELFRIPEKLKELHLELCNINLLDLKIPTCLEVMNLKNNKLQSKGFKLKPDSSETLKITRLDLTDNYFKDFDFSSLNNLSLDFLKLTNNMLEDTPAISKNVFCAIFNESADCLVNNY